MDINAIIGRVEERRDIAHVRSEIRLVTLTNICERDRAPLRVISLSSIWRLFISVPLSLSLFLSLLPLCLPPPPTPLLVPPLTVPIFSLHLPCSDFDPFDLRMQLPLAVARLHHAITTHGHAYVHCTAGLGRAPAVAVRNEGLWIGERGKGEKGAMGD